jgi:acetyl-CoA carboxylase carboxyl transferase subunit alpha
MEKIKELEFEKSLTKFTSAIERLENQQKSTQKDNRLPITKLQQELKEKTKEIYSNITPWQIVQIARHPQRPHTMDYINTIMEDFYELHGDRIHSDDPAIVAGIGKFNSRTIVFVGHQKGKNIEENIAINFGMAHPEGYRKALRVMKLAEKFKFPVITFIDTPGAYPHIQAEERNQALAIAQNLYEMAFLKTPIISIVIGEGGSGGALGIGVSDKILMLEYSIYSVISPEGCASILWKDQKAVEQASQALKLTASDLLKLGLIDVIIPEPLGAAHRNPSEAIKIVGSYIQKHIELLSTIPISEIVNTRYKKYRNIGLVLSEETEE